MLTASFHAQEGRLEQGFGAPESLVSNGDHLTVRELVGFFKGRRRGGGGHFLFKVQSDVAELFFDVTDDFPLGGGREGVSPLGQDLHKVVGQITAWKRQIYII